MKVTVCFNSVRVVVPCGEGDLLVRDLIQKATIRYKKATAKPSQSWVTVHNLKQLDGGILDPDDRLNDVADDREQIIAIYDERHDHHGGDGTSDPSSDSENHSPDIFKGVEHKFAPFSRNDIEITNEDINGTPPPLHVRRGSEPALNRLSPIPNNVSYLPPDPTKRWSAAPTYIVQDQSQPHNHSTPMKSHDGGYHHSSYDDDNVFLYERGEGSGEEKTPSSTPLSSSQATTAFTPFSRDSNRLSVQVLSDSGRWADAADRALYEGMRREPLGGSASTPAHSRDPSHDDNSQQINLIVLSNDHGPLGIHVIPSTDRRGQDQGLLVEGVEPDGRIAKDGRIQVHDRIIEINGRPLHNITFHKAQEIFKDAMQAPELCLKIIKKNMQSNGLVEGEERSGVRVASTRKVPSSRAQSNIQQSNTRKIGRRVTVNLVKGTHGLGFSITTRDNQMGGEAPIYIKSILPKGAAIEDGTLRIGDRLLEVNDVEVTGRSQSEVAGLLRQITVGGTATLTVSRQETKEVNTSSNQEGGISENEASSSPKLPRQLVSTQSPDSLPFLRQPPEKSGEDSLMFPWKQREILMFEIPVHDSERAGLGVSVKGKTSSGPNGSVDLGIFVKNVIHGGAASRDGRLFQNDQLVNINGISLLGKPNSESMKTLRNAMNQEGPVPGIISLTVARRIDARERSSPSGGRSGRDSASSLLTNSSGTETLGGAKSSPATPTPDQSGSTHNSENTLILGGRGEKFDGDLSGSDPFDVRNPVIRQLTGNNNPLRNESYYKATHDTWNTSQLQQLVMRSEQHESLNNTNNNLNNVMGSPTVNLPSRDTLIIHDEYETANYPSQGNQGTGPVASSGNFSDNNPTPSDDAYTSQTSLEESGAGFSRDQLWRQSMSEKRHATLDAKNTDTYQRNKKAREERERQRQIMSAQEKLNGAVQGLGCQGLGTNMGPTPDDEAGRNRELLGVEAVDGKLVRASSDDSLASHILLQRTNHSQETSQQHDHPIAQDIGRRRQEVGPGLGMKKSSSLESLQTMVQEMALEMEDNHRLGSGRVPRGRGCNESFRAAVDRSIEAPLTGLRNKMETQELSVEEYFANLVAEEESESSGSGFGRDNSRQSSVNSGGEDKLKKGGNKKKQGIFKGLGSMFRFGKHRKSIDNSGMLQPTSLDGLEHEQGRTEVDKAEMERLAAARRQQQEEHDRMQEQYRRMLENTSRNNQPSSLNMPEDDAGGPTSSRSERMHQLRAEHQRRHQQRKGQYPTDEVEERYDSQIRQRLEPVPSEPKSEPPRHSRSHSYDVYGEGRPGSRAGYADPHKYSHYVNYEQIQQHLRREQREYQSQRGPRDSGREHQHRPVSNYYEYESVQAMILHAQSNSTSLPRRHHPPPPIPPPAAAVVHAKSSKNMNNTSNNNGINNNFFSTNSQSHHLPMYKQPPSSSSSSIHSAHQSRGPHMGSHIGGHENIYGSSGYRPASAYGSGPHHNKPPQPPSHHHTNSLTVPGSKV